MLSYSAIFKSRGFIIMTTNNASGFFSEQSYFLPDDFNKKKFNLSYSPTNNQYLKEIQNCAKNICLGKKDWPLIEKINAWMISAETATFMKWGGLGMVASELAESFNSAFSENGHCCSVITPLYLGNTGKKKAFLQENTYYGAENRSINIDMIGKFSVKFMNDKKKLVKNSVGIYRGEYNNVPYILEINTNPGMTDVSDLPAQANAMGISYNELVDIILKTADLK